MQQKSRVSRDPDGGEVGERDCDNSRTKVQEVKVPEDAEEFNWMNDEEWEEGECPSVLFITVDMRSKSLSDKSRKFSNQQGSQAHKRRKINISSSSVRREEPKGEIRGESDC